MDVFHHHDGVVHQNTDGKDQSEQRHPVEGEAPGPGREQRDRQGQDHRRADDEGLAPTQRDQHQHDDQAGGEDQFVDQGHRLVVGGDAVVTSDGEIDALGNEGALELLDAFQQLVGNLDRVFAGLFGDGQGDGREFALTGNALCRRRRTRTQPDVALRRIRTQFDLGDIGQIHRRALVQPHHQTADVPWVH